MSDKAFPASELKLQRLREDGTIPFSRDLTTSALIFATVCAFLVFPLVELRTTFAELLVTKTPDLSRLLHLIVKYLLPTLALMAFTVLLIWLVQTRFYFRFGPKKKRRRVESFGRALRVLSALGKAALVGGTVFFLLFSEIRRLGGESRLALDSGLNQRIGKAAVGFGIESTPSSCSSDLILGESVRPAMSIFFAVTAACIIISFLLGILSRFVAGLAFQYEHRMTRGELEAEARENESSPMLREMVESERWPEITEN